METQLNPSLSPPAPASPRPPNTAAWSSASTMTRTRPLHPYRFVTTGISRNQRTLYHAVHLSCIRGLSSGFWSTLRQKDLADAHPCQRPHDLTYPRLSARHTTRRRIRRLKKSQCIPRNNSEVSKLQTEVHTPKPHKGGRFQTFKRSCKRAQEV
jgi:hypothetical protein